MTRAPATSDQSGEILNSTAPAHVTYIFDDGHRRSVTLTVGEAARLRQTGIDRTTRLSRFVAWKSWRALATWISAVVAGAVIAGSISDTYSDKQREVELEGTLTKEVSSISVGLFQQAQAASRATGAEHQQEIRDKAADRWVLDSSSVTPTLRAYYPGSGVAKEWDSFQSAMYDWTVLGCCTSPEGRPAIVGRIRNYLETYVGPSVRPAPVSDPWGALVATAAPDPELYQWVGYYLLLGRGALLERFQDESPSLD